MREWEKADIQFDVLAENCEDSNFFLRKFYDELSKYDNVAWNFQSFREGNVIHVGHNNCGEMWLDYKERGKLNKIYFKTFSDELHSFVQKALIEAKKDHKTMKSYTIITAFDTKDIVFCDMNKQGINIKSFCKKSKNYINITFMVKAFGKHDLKYVQTQKINYLNYLLCVYTNLIFNCVQIKCREEEYNVPDNEWKEPNPDWIDWDEQYINKENKIISIRSEFFYIFRQIIDMPEYGRKLRLLLNSSQDIYVSKKMMDIMFNGEPRLNIPGYVDVINTMMVSSLEPLANIKEFKVERCKECGNLKYSIKKRVRDLCNTYFPEYLARQIYDTWYNERSAFLHEGKAFSNEFYCGFCVPLLNPDDGRSIIFPTTRINSVLFDYLTFVFRKVANTILEEQMEEHKVMDESESVNN